MKISTANLSLILAALSTTVLLSSCSPSDTAEQPKAEEKQATPEVAHALALVKRVTPQFADKVQFNIDPQATTPVINGMRGYILICATNERECIRAYGYYLRNIAHVHMSWNGDNTSGSQFVIPAAPINVPAALPYNYAYNYCTLSYSGAHWDKARWEREIDLLALNGFQYVLVTSGLEKVWQNFLRELGYPDEKIMAFIPNPAYSAWWNMGNLEGEGGPISQTLIDSEAELGQFIVHRLKELGMEPVLQGYVGFLPHDFPQEGLNGRIIPQGKWCGYYNRPGVLDPTSEAFPQVAKLWYKHLHAVYGITGKVYGGDLFHEGGNKGNTNLAVAAQAVQRAMIADSPDAIWLLQAWGGNPDKRLLDGCAPEHTIILALNKNLAPHGPQKFNFSNFPYVWCELANFGGNIGMYGGAEILEKLSSGNTDASGIGLISEGLETNPLYYALLYERINNRGNIDRETFLHHYAQARYGCCHTKIMQSLRFIMNGLYKPDKVREGCLENIMCARPKLDANKASTWSNPHLYYSPKEVEAAARLMLQAGQEKGEALTSLETYQYDLADLCRQVLADRARVQLARCKDAYDKKDAEAFKRESEIFLQLIRDTAEVLSCSEHFLLGAYLQGAENRATTPEDKKANAVSLRRLMTTWTPQIGVLNDYAHRQYAELMEHYYLKRWEAYFELCSAQLAGTATNADAGTAEKQVTTNNGEAVEYITVKQPKLDAIDTSFATQEIQLMKQPTGNIMQLAERILSQP
ncbi:MAG: alpha-N-acetylglucosaminidase [Akkermansiaceae bacterium]|nr:alpha-N-acetylglucosaminidase [Akkermansiaceae bacterium]